jgi:hypothetical protein
VSLDTAALGKLVPLLQLGPNGQPAVDLLTRLQRLDADLVADGDLLRLTLRAPLKQ